MGRGKTLFWEMSEDKKYFVECSRTLHSLTVIFCVMKSLVMSIVHVTRLGIFEGFKSQVYSSAGESIFGACDRFVFGIGRRDSIDNSIGFWDVP